MIRRTSVLDRTYAARGNYASRTGDFPRRPSLALLQPLQSDGSYMDLANTIATALSTLTLPVLSSPVSFVGTNLYAG